MVGLKKNNFRTMLFANCSIRAVSLFGEVSVYDRVSTLLGENHAAWHIMCTTCNYYVYLTQCFIQRYMYMCTYIFSRERSKNLIVGGQQ